MCGYLYGRVRVGTCMHVHVWLRVCTCTFGYVYAHLRVCTCMHMYVWVRVCACTCMHEYVWVPVCMCAFGYVYARVQVFPDLLEITVVFIVFGFSANFSFFTATVSEKPCLSYSMNSSCSSPSTLRFFQLAEKKFPVEEDGSHEVCLVHQTNRMAISFLFSYFISFQKLV